MTRDLKGFFFLPHQWEQKYIEFKTILETLFKTKLKRNRNSFSSCFQYEEARTVGRFHRRFKVYNKLLQNFQSAAPQQAVGMNTTAIFNAPSRMLQVYQEAVEEGATRLEISYYADSLEAQDSFVAEQFEQKVSQDLHRFQLCLN